MRVRDVEGKCVDEGERRKKCRSKFAGARARIVTSAGHVCEKETLEVEDGRRKERERREEGCWGAYVGVA